MIGDFIKTQQTPLARITDSSKVKDLEHGKENNAEFFNRSNEKEVESEQPLEVEDSSFERESHGLNQPMTGNGYKLQQSNSFVHHQSQ